MAGTVTATETTHTSVKLVKWAWTSTAGGAADGATSNHYDGKILLLTTVPDAVAAPTTLYDITVTDSNGVDVLAGAGANRSATATEQVAESSLGAVAGSKLTLNVSAAGAAKQGTVYLHIR